MGRTTATTRRTAERKARERAARARAEAARRRHRRRVVALVGSVVGVLALVAGLVTAAVVSGGSTTKGSPARQGADAVAALVASVPSATIDAVGPGTVVDVPHAVKDPRLTADGKPLVLYIGAEYCPYCAGERWAIVQALSRFGAFRGLGETHSTPQDAYPNTASFTFHGASYRSDVLAFVGRELQTVTGAPLDVATPDEAALWHKYTGVGSYPFLDIGGRFVAVEPPYRPAALAGLTMDQIARAMSRPSSAVARDVIGEANVLTAAICIVTSQQPSSVCSAPGVQAAAGRLHG